MLYGKRLQDYLVYQVLGTQKKPPQQSQIPRRRKAQPRKGPPRNEAYKAWIRTLPCLQCGIEHRSEAAHTGTDGSMSMKASDHSQFLYARTATPKHQTATTLRVESGGWSGGSDSALQMFAIGCGANGRNGRPRQSVVNVCPLCMIRGFRDKEAAKLWR